jgi:sterol desaturase/sphingolipid hydroxylase (fatty acid hydroxylase superfamily)
MLDFNFQNMLLDWLGDARVDLTRYAVFAFAIWLIIWVILAKPLSARKIRPDTPQPVQLIREFFFSVRSIAVFSTVGLIYNVLHNLGWMWGPAVADRLGPVWGVFTFIALAYAHDTWFYWTHRIMHHRKLFRQFHRIHHQSFNPSPFTAYSFDMKEAFVQAIYMVIWSLIVPTSYWVISAYMIFQIARNSIGHCGYELFPANKKGKPMFDWMTTVTHHDLHHARAGYNFGLWFTHWDRWMGTEDPTYHQKFAEVVGQRRERKTDLATASI